MKDLVLYIHGKGGSAEESRHYETLFPDSEVIGLDYHASTPWDAGMEIRSAVESLHRPDSGITLIANSIGAFFSMYAGIDRLIRKAFFISPIVDMEQLIRNMMTRAGITEQELAEKGSISTSFGETLSWDYFCFVRDHPARWEVPTRILYGGMDNLTDSDTMQAFAAAHGAALTVMEDGEHWFHTEEQMRFLDAWILAKKS